MSGSLGDLLAKAGLNATESAEEPAAALTDAAEPVRYDTKVIVRRQRKGFGGRTVTTVSGVLSGHDELAKILRKQLGTGTRVDEDLLILQGDQRERAARWFESQGVEKVVRS